MVWCRRIRIWREMFIQSIVILPTRDGVQLLSQQGSLKQKLYLVNYVVGLGGLKVTCSPRDPRFTGSNPTELDGFFQDVKILSTSPPGGTLSWGSRV